ncbi:MAG TPA: cell division protein ZapA [Nitrospiria bacterium]
MNNPIEVEIFGQEYTIRGGGDSQHISKLARYVDGKMREIAKTSKNLPPTKLALLAAINITDELFQVRQEKQNRDTLVEKKTRDLIEGIEEQFSDLKLY